MENKREPWTVLYVEDEENDLLFMEVAFRKAGLKHLLYSARNGQEAVDYLSGVNAYAARDQHPLPSLLLLDLNLPLLSGFEVLTWVRQQRSFQSLPVVVFSSSTRLEDQKKAMDLGANSYLQKPISGLMFAEVLAHLQRYRPG